MANNPIDAGLLAGFAEEVRDYVPRIKRALETLRSNPDRLDVLEEAHRLTHSIKGAASMVGLSALSHVAWLEESAIEEVAAQQLIWNDAAADTLVKGIAAIETCVCMAAAGAPGRRACLESAVIAFRRLRHEPVEGDAEAVESMLAGAETEGAIASAQPQPVAPPKPKPAPAALPAPAARKNEVPAELLDTFRQEADEILQNVGGLMRELSESSDIATVLGNVRRYVHTLKGAAGSVGVTDVAQLSHRMEDLLDEFGDGRVDYSGEVRSLLFATFDCLTDLASGQGSGLMTTRLGDLYERYEKVLQSARAAVPEPAASSDVNSDLLDAFRSEAEDNLRTAGDLLRALERQPSNRTPLQDVRRIIHTVKGASNMVGLPAVAEVAHTMEETLARLSNGAGPVEDGELRLAFGMLDMLNDLLAGSAAEAASLQRVGQLNQRQAVAPEPLASLGEEQAIDLSAASEAPSAVPAAVESRSSQYVRVPIERLDSLVRLVSELVVNRSTFEQHLAAYAREMSELGLSVDRLRRVSSQLDGDFEVSALKGGFGQLTVRGVVAGPGDKRADFDTLEFDRYTGIHLISRDLNETSADIGSAVGELSHRAADFDSYLNRLSMLTGELQDGLMRLRMVPLANLATRLHRTVRTTAEKANKQVDLVIEGEMVELDKTVIEEVAGPLEHLLRNGVDHGIESESLRRILGKNPRGRIVVNARNEGTQVTISVRDDGAGMDAENLRAAAIRTGLLTEERAGQLSDAELCDLIFEPGFTTSRTVTETSGRGVGMDVVRSAVLKLKGTVQVETETGNGTLFTIRLPMSLAILRVLLVKACNEVFAMPLSVISQIKRVEHHQLEKIGNRTVVRMGNEVVPAVHLGEVLSLASPPDQSLRRLPVLFLQLGNQRLALLVDQLVEAREVVVKNLGSTIRRAPCVSGATLMGDGSVVLILNPAELLPAAESSGGAANRLTRATIRQQPKRSLEVLVVDDSTSVRRVLTNLVRNNGWSPQAAKDGLEALEMLQRGYTPDVVLLDIEMPRMDGFELTSAIRSTPVLKDLPIVMLTSRSGEKHRNKAFELGVTDYLVKPYQEETLLAVVRRVVRESKEAVTG